jgi:hypothetical protein
MSMIFSVFLMVASLLVFAAFRERPAKTEGAAR